MSKNRADSKSCAHSLCQLDSRWMTGKLLRTGEIWFPIHVPLCCLNSSPSAVNTPASKETLTISAKSETCKNRMCFAPLAHDLPGQADSQLGLF